jgi:spore cortex formation protein SpoVR/YcgB (stage V sporulation)
VAKNEQELLQAVLNARQSVNEIDASLSEAKEVKKNAETELIEFMENHDLKSFKSSVLNCSVARKETLYVSVEEDKKQEAYQWIEEDCGRGDLLKKTIHNKTLSSFISERLKAALVIPQELFKYYFKPELSITISKGGN